jgi:hypothetical protein
VPMSYVTECTNKTLTDFAVISAVEAEINVVDVCAPQYSSISLSEISCSVLNLLLTTKVSPSDDEFAHRFDLWGDRKRIESFTYAVLRSTPSK